MTEPTDPTPTTETATTTSPPQAATPEARAAGPSRGDHVGKANLDLAKQDAAVRGRQEAALAFEWVAPSRLGAPSKYEEWMPAYVYNLLINRDVIFTKKMVATRLRINVDTLREWLAIRSDLSAAVAQGLAEQEGWLATQMANGLKYSASMYAVLKNLHDWRDKSEDTNQRDFLEAMKAASKAAKRVDWDKQSKAIKERISSNTDVIDVPVQQDSDAPTPTVPMGGA